MLVSLAGLKTGDVLSSVIEPGTFLSVCSIETATFRPDRSSAGPFRQQSEQIADERVFLVEIGVKQPGILRDVAVPLDETAALTPEQIAFVLRQVVVPIRGRFQGAHHASRRPVVLAAFLKVLVRTRFDVEVV